MINNPIKIIRAVWGNNLSVINEIPKQQTFADEVVYVWGKQNYEFLKKMGYCQLAYVSEINTDIQMFNTHLKHFGHKLQALKYADEAFDEYLFLDWDVKIIKELDDDFFSIIRSGNNVQCPLYAYNKDYEKQMIDFYIKNGKLNEHLTDFLKIQIDGLKKYSWKMNDLFVLPNFCFFYSNNTKTATKLFEIMQEYNLETCIEEFAMWLFSNCSLEEYVLKYEPLVIRGKERDVNLPNMDWAFKTINQYIGKKVNKQIYLCHELQATTN